MEAAMDVVTRSLPVAGYIEAAALKVMVDLFAEQFEGVHSDHVSGQDVGHTGYNAFLDQGKRGLPGGSTICCFMSYGMQDSAVSRNTVLRGKQAMHVFSDFGKIRATTEGVILCLQMNCCQLRCCRKWVELS